MAVWQKVLTSGSSAEMAEVNIGGTPDTSDVLFSWNHKLY